MAWQFPEVSFDWLSQLPATIRAEDTRKKREATLADLNSTDPSSLEKKAGQLMSIGDVETGMKLYDAAMKRRTLNQKISEAEAYSRIYPDLIRGIQNGKGAPGTPQESVFDPFGGVPPQGTPANPAPQAPAAPQYNWPTPGPQSNLGLTPEQTQPAPEAPQQRIRLAQAGPITQLPNLTGQQSQQPSWMQGAQAGGAVAPGAGLSQQPVDPVEQTAQQRVSRPLPTDRAGLENEATALANVLRLPQKSPSGATQALMARYRAILDRLQLPQEAKMYQLDLIQRLRDGQPYISLQDWQKEKENRKPLFEEMIKASGPYLDDLKKTNELRGQIAAMSKLLESESFVSGRVGAQALQWVGSAFNGLADAARALGVKPDLIPEWKSLKSSTAQIEAFRALSNQVIYAKLGTLGNQISEGDRNFITAAFTNLSNSREGNILLAKILEQTAVYQEGAAKAVLDYRTKNEFNATRPGMEHAVQRYAKENRLFSTDDKGNLSPTGQALQAEIERIRQMQGGPRVGLGDYIKSLVEPLGPGRTTRSPGSDRPRVVPSPTLRPYKNLMGEDGLPEPFTDVGILPPVPRY